MIENLLLHTKTGEKKELFLEINGIERLPVTLIEGKEKGKTLLITSGIHCTEYTGIETAIELAQELKPDQIKGRVILVHPVNRTGFEAGQLNSCVPKDNKNLNRVFPGNRDGSASEQIADYIVTNLHSQADYYIDMHGGNIQEDLTPYVYYVTVTTPEISQKAKEMANRVNVNYKVGSKVGGEGSYNYAGACKIPSILIERGCGGIWTKDDVVLYKEDIKNVMRFLGILEDSIQEIEYKPKRTKQILEIYSSVAGCWYPAKRAGEKVYKGELAGEIKDYFGNIIEKYYFKENGVILFQISSLGIQERQNIITYGQI
ncbi:MAG: succinylglutamate desuccinylase/aspartoacylase family protein [Candidatus Galacturonibacter soehngenii]|nr:succinylglutamate desuccinylase/aspartoacylase family protein [Candidatus Galacturonibacter soehngenii]